MNTIGYGQFQIVQQNLPRSGECHVFTVGNCKYDTDTYSSNIESNQSSLQIVRKGLAAIYESFRDSSQRDKLFPGGT